jgi:hypothetical protein
MIVTKDDIYVSDGVLDGVFGSDGVVYASHKNADYQLPPHSIAYCYKWIENDWVVINQKALDDYLRAYIPQSITPRQIRLQLSAIGMRQAVEDYVASASLEIKDWWEFSLAYERNAPLLVEAATGLEMTSEQLDQFFIEASQL